MQYKKVRKWNIKKLKGRKSVIKIEIEGGNIEMRRENRRKERGKGIN